MKSPNTVRWDRLDTTNAVANDNEFHAQSQPTFTRPMTIPECALTMALIVSAVMFLVSNAR